MDEQLIPFRPSAIVFIGVYLSSLIAIGFVGYKARRDHSLRDFYLAGKGIGFVALLLTLYSTQYSGNTLFGFTGKTYRIGYAWAMCIHFMTAVIVFYLLLAPKLHRVARRHGFITPGDFLNHRFDLPALNALATIIMVVAISNYLLAQLMAMGRALEGLTRLDPERAYIYGVVLLALIIVVYETLGGFRAVVWTDVIQGSVLLVGFGILLVLVFQNFGSLRAATETLLNSPPEGPPKVRAPDANRCREWLSYVLVVGMGGALYPQAIQRIYAARSANILRRSLAVMAFLPLTTTLIAVIVGIIGAAYIPGLTSATTDRSDALLTIICRQVQEHSEFGYWLVVVLFSAVLAAIMSTADSVLLSISSMLTKDLYGRFLRPQATERELTRVGKVFSWALIVLLTGLAIALKGTTLVQLLDQKFDLLVQLAPAFFLGLHWSGLRARPTLAGLAAGTVVALSLTATLNVFDHGKLFGMHSGFYGLIVNVLIAVIGSLRGSGNG